MVEQSEVALLGGVPAAAELLRGRRVVVLTGAGMSTRSGIPDYRGPQTRRLARSPVQYKAFAGDAHARQRYWARAAVGWPKFRAARPNVAHEAIARLEHAGLVHGLITQNVDELHTAAGSRDVVELHGVLSRTRCMRCGCSEPRDAVQERLVARNPGIPGVTADIAPDGDAELSPEQIEGFVVPVCLHCGGALKPDVVFFGESIPAEVTARAWSVFDRAEVLLVAGSSLTVFSGYRFVRRADKLGIPVVIFNLGETRGDPHATLRVDADLTLSLPKLLQSLG